MKQFYFGFGGCKTIVEGCKMIQETHESLDTRECLRMVECVKSEWGLFGLKKFFFFFLFSNMKNLSGLC